MREQNSQFKKDVLKAKAKYRKRRKFIILAIMTFALAVTLLQTFLYIRDKKQINAQLAEQNQMIENLDKENKVNELVIDKLKDPYFITDLVRQEYGLSYQGELIFNIPLQENFLQATIKSIMDGNLEKSEDNNGRIDDSKIPELAKKMIKSRLLKKGSEKSTDKQNTIKLAIKKQKIIHQKKKMMINKRLNNLKEQLTTQIQTLIIREVTEDNILLLLFLKLLYDEADSKVLNFNKVYMRTHRRSGFIDI